MKNIMFAVAVTAFLAACAKDEFPQRNPDEPVEIVDCKPFDRDCQEPYLLRA